MNSAFGQKPSVLEPYHWKNRILIVFAANDQHQLRKEQLTLFESDIDGLEDRDLVIFDINESLANDPHGNLLDKRTVQQFRVYYKVKQNSFEVILIGKDGGEKLRTDNEILKLSTLFSTIDAMPMRRREMRNKH